jgi:phenylalanyl-tRNA synthetase alpha subunit
LQAHVQRRADHEIAIHRADKRVQLAENPICEVARLLRLFGRRRRVQYSCGILSGGFGLGFERLIMYLTGMQNIRDVIPFHRTPGQATF